MSLGIFTGRGLGNYAAPPANQPRIDLGPEFSSEQAAGRQVFERGLRSFLDYSRSYTGDPLTYRPDDPRLRAYQEAQQELRRTQPEYGAELTQMAAQAADFSERYRSRLARLSRSPSLHGAGYMLVPTMGPGLDLIDAAGAGEPVGSFELKNQVIQGLALLVLPGAVVAYALLT